MTAIEKAIAALDRLVKRYQPEASPYLDLGVIFCDYEDDELFKLNAVELLSELRAERASALDEFAKDEVRSQWEKVEGLEDAINEVAEKGLCSVSHTHAITLFRAARLQLERQRG